MELDVIPLRKLVAPSSPDAKDGCLHCTLAAFYADFPDIADEYKRDASKLNAKLNNPHATQSINIGSHVEWTPADILFVYDFPLAAEDKDDAIGLGKRNDLLLGIVEELPVEYPDFKGLTTAITFATRCRTPGQRDPTRPEINCCAPQLMREIAARKPKVIVPLGNAAMKLFLDREGIFELSGIPSRSLIKLPIDDVWVVPCMPPDYILKNSYMGERFVDALTKVLDVALKGCSKDNDGFGTYEVVDTVERLSQVVTAMENTKGIVSGDTETGALTPFQSKYPPLLCFSFSWKYKQGVVVPLDHADSPWTLSTFEPRLEDIADIEEPKPKSPDKYKSPKFKEKATRECADWLAKNDAYKSRVLEKRVKRWRKRRARAERERPEVIALLVRLFKNADIRWVMQNGKFDFQHIRKAVGVWIRGKIIDTLHHHAVIQDRRGTHGLDNLAWKFTGMGGYDKPLDYYRKKHAEAKDSYAFIPGPVLFPYASQDSDVTRRVIRKIRKHPEFLRDERHDRLASGFMPILSETLARMEYNGSAIDTKVVAKLDVDFTEARDDATIKLMALPTIARFNVEERERLLEAGQKKKGEAFRFNPGSDTQVRRLLFEDYGMRPIELTDKGFEVLTKRYEQVAKRDDSVQFIDIQQDAIDRRQWQFFSINAEVLNEYDLHGNELSPLVLKYRENSKLLSTYVVPLQTQLDQWSRIHGSFNPIGTASGRISCVVGSTMIPTSVGMLCISDLPEALAKSKVSAYTHRNRWRPIRRAFVKGYEAMYRVEFSDGSTIVCTRAHRFLMSDGWRDLASLAVGSLAVSGLDKNLRNGCSQVGDENERQADEDCASVRLPDRANVSDEYGDTAGGWPRAKSLGRNGLGQQHSLLVGAWVEKTVERSPVYPTCVGNEGQSAGGEVRAGGEARRRSTANDGRSGRAVGGDCEGVQDKRVVRCREHAPIEHRIRGVDAADFSAHGEHHPNLGTVLARINRSLYRPSVRGEPGNLLRFALQGARHHSPVTNAGEANGEAARDDAIAGYSSQKSRLLESQSGGNYGIGGASRIEHIARPSILSGHGMSQNEEQDVRFCVSDGEANRGDRWGFSRDVDANEIGSGQGTVGERTPLDDREVFVRNGVAANVTSCERHPRAFVEVVSIEPVGFDFVWDMEVEEDASYLAGGVFNHNSSGPNLQNIPREAKPAYISRFGSNGLILQADYSQIELRVAASLFKEPTMLRAYREGLDLHLITTLDIFKLSESEYNALPEAQREDMRRMAKVINFGIIYGMSASGIAAALKKQGIHKTIEECQTTFDDFRHVRPKLFRNMGRFVAHTASSEHQCVTTFLGRSRRFPELRSRDNYIRSRAERQTSNTIVQGQAGEMTLLALCIIEREMRRQKLRSIPTITVHDSIIVDMHVDEFYPVATLLLDTMEKISERSDAVYPGLDWSWLKVPIVSELKAGPSWERAAKIKPSELYGKTVKLDGLFDPVDKKK